MLKPKYSISVNDYCKYMFKFVFLKTLEMPSSIFSGLLLMKCSYSVSDLYSILSEIPEMPDWIYKTCVAGHRCSEIVEIFFYLPKKAKRESNDKRKVVEDMLETRRFFYHVSGKLFFCPKTSEGSSFKYSNIDHLSAVHLRNNSNVTLVKQDEFLKSHDYYGCLIAIREYLYTMIEEGL